MRRVVSTCRPDIESCWLLYFWIMSSCGVNGSCVVEWVCGKLGVKQWVVGKFWRVLMIGPLDAKWFVVMLWKQMVVVWVGCQLFWVVCQLWVGGLWSRSQLWCRLVWVCWGDEECETLERSVGGWCCLWLGMEREGLEESQLIVVSWVAMVLRLWWVWPFWHQCEHWLPESVCHGLPPIGLVGCRTIHLWIQVLQVGVRGASWRWQICCPHIFPWRCCVGNCGANCCRIVSIWVPWQ